MALVDFQIPFGKINLIGDTYQEGCSTIVLHGAGQSSRERFTRLRGSLYDRGIPSACFDFIGHGDTGGCLVGSTLRQRTQQAAKVIQHACTEPLTLIGVSMSGYTAVKLTERFSIKNLILLVPAVYTAKANNIPFGPEFSKAIRDKDSWKNSDAFTTLHQFKGNLLIIAAESDAVIPDEVIEGIYSAAVNAASRHVHVVPGSLHSPLFPTEQGFDTALGKIVTVCNLNDPHT